MRRSIAIAVLALLSSLGCRDTVPATQIMVLVEAQSQVREAARSVRVIVRSGQGEQGKWEDRYDKALTVDADKLQWPIELALLPKNGDATRVYEVTATAIDESASEIARVRAISGFVPHKVLMLGLRFDDACIGRQDMCDATQSCRGGVCQDAHIDAGMLLPYDRSAGPMLLWGLDGGTDSDSNAAGDTDGSNAQGGRDGGEGPVGDTDAATSGSCTGTDTPCDGTCVDLESDPDNCGSCGVACRAAPGDERGCNAGACPVVLVQLTTLDEPASALAVDASAVYWGTSYSTQTGFPAMTINVGEVFKVPIDGGLPTTLATMTPVVNLVTDDTALYLAMRPASGFGSNGTVASLGLEGGTPTPLGGNGTTVAASNGTAYWTYTAAFYRRGPKDSAPVMLHASVIPGAGSSLAIALHADTLYGMFYMTGSASYAVWKLPAAGGEPTKVTDVAGTGGVYGLAVDATNIYWTEAGTGSASGRIMKAPSAGGMATALATGQASPRAVVADGAAVIWANYGTSTTGSIMKIAAEGGTPIELAGQRPTPNTIALDSTAVYWTEANAVMMRSPK
jgi:hypothetical protein